MARRRIGWAALLLSCAIGLFLGAGTYTFHEARGTSYLSNDPTSCVNCHIMRDPYESWQHSSHHAVATCNDCHVSQHAVGKWITKADNGFRHSWAFTFEDFHEPIQLHPRGTRVLQGNCLRCHSDFVSELLEHHGDLTNAEACWRCHSQAGHGAHR